MAYHPCVVFLSVQRFGRIAVGCLCYLLLQVAPSLPLSWIFLWVPQPKEHMYFAEDD